MADDKLQEKLADYVEDAHAMEQNDLKMIDSMISTRTIPRSRRCCKTTSARPRSTRGVCARGSKLWAGEPPHASRPRRLGPRYLRVWETWQGGTRQARTQETATPRSTWR